MTRKRLSQQAAKETTIPASIISDLLPLRCAFCAFFSETFRRTRSVCAQDDCATGRCRSMEMMSLLELLEICLPGLKGQDRPGP